MYSAGQRRASEGVVSSLISSTDLTKGIITVSTNFDYREFPDTSTFGLCGGFFLEQGLDSRLQERNVVIADHFQPHLPRAIDK